MATFRLQRRLVAALGSLVALVLLAGAGAVATAASSRQALDEARRYEVAARQAASLGRLAREQYIHEAHTILLRDRSHVGHHDGWVARFRRDGATFRELLPATERPRLDEVLDQSHQLAEVFAHEIVPAVERHDQEAVRQAHRQADTLVEQMTSHADALADALEHRAVEAEQAAAQTARRVPWLAGAVAVLAVGLALVVARLLWRAFARPLGSLLGAAGEVASGHRTARVGPLEAQEFHEVGRAFDAMLDTLAQKEQALLASERLATVGRIAAGVAHELNNPIGVMRGYLKTMRREHTGTALLEELRILDEEAAICQRIADDLLTYARGPSLQRSTIDAATLARRVVERLEVGTEAPAEVQMSVEPCALSVDPVRMQQVLANLLRNARQASAPGQSIELQGHRLGDRYEFVVADRGEGLTEQARERLFEPFFTTRGEGAGLGLAVCYGLVIAHGGQLQVEERSGGGVALHVALPLPAEAS